MIPTIEQIVEDLLAGNITQADAVNWLNQHAADAHADLRDYFAAKAMQGDMSSQSSDSDTGFIIDFGDEIQLEALAANYYRMADAMMKARKV